MKKYLIAIILALVLILGGWYLVSQQYKPLIDDTPVTNSDLLLNTYSSSKYGFSLNHPSGYTVDEAYAYQANPTKVIDGVKFTIPAALAEGTNLSKDSYMSVEKLPQTQSSSTCSAAAFLDGTHKAVTQIDNGVTYSVASSSNAGAGNRYDETVFALSNTNPCVAVRYFVHHTNIQNYPEGTVQAFDLNTLMSQFDTIRRSLLVETQ